MANIDELQIEISASNAKVLTAIRGLKQSLQSLSSALNIKAADSLISSLGNLSGSLDNLNSSIRNLDTGKLKEISSAIGSLSRSGSKLSQAGNSFGTLQKGATGAAKAIEKVDNAYSNETPERLASWIQQGEVEIERLRGQAEALRSILGSNRRIPKDFYSTAGDDAKSLIGYMGIKNTSYGGGEDMQELAEQFRQITGSTLPDNYTDAFIEIGERIRDCVQQAEDFERAGYEMSAALESMQNNPIDEIADSFQRIETVTSSNPFEPLVESLERLQGINLSSGQLSGITTLAESMGRLGGKASATAASSLQGIAEGLRAFQGLQIPQLEGIDVLSQNLRSLGSGQGLTKAANALPFVAEGLRSLQGIHFDNVENIEGLAHAISRFGLSNAQKAISTLPQMADSFKRFAASMATVPQVSQNTIDLANAMANLAQQGGKAGVAANTLHPKIKRLGSTMKSTATHGKSLAAIIGKIYATYWLLFRAFGKLKNAIDFSADLTEVQNVVNHTFGEMTNKVEDFADIAIQKFGMSELQAKKTASRFQAMGVAMGIAGDQVKKATANFGAFNDVLSAADYNGAADSMADMSLNLTKLSADFASFYNMDIDEVSQKMEAVFTGMTRPLREFGLDLTQATLQEWALKNGIEANMKTMSQAEKTMLRYQYVMANAGAAVGDFARTMNTWANVVRTIGQQFQKLGGLIGTGLINTFKPVLIRMRDFLNTLIGLVEKALNAIGKLLGWQIEIEEVGVTFDDAVDGIDDIADGTGRAADNAERMNKAIRGWDKLNVLNSKDSGGGSGGGGGGASGGGGGKSDVTGGARVSYKDYESDIDSWFELGSRIGDKLKEGMQSIDWDSIFQSAKDFGKNFASFLNGLISPELFYELGRTIANAINTAIYATLSFGQEFDFADFGKSIGASINGFFKNFDWYAAGLNISTWLSGFGELIRNAFSEMDWKEVKTGLGEALRGFLDGLTPDAVIGLIGLTVLTKVGRNIIKGIVTGLFGEGGLISLGTLSLGVEGFEFAGITEALGSLSTIAAPAVAVIGLVAASVTSLVESFGGFKGLLEELKGRFEPIIEKFKEFAESIHFSERIDALKSAFSGLADSFKALVGSLGSFKGVWEVVLDIFEMVAHVVGNTLIAGFNMLISVVTGVVNTLSGIVRAVSGVIEIFGGLNSMLASLGRLIVGVLTGDIDKVKESLQDMASGLDSIKEGFMNFGKGVADALEGLGQAVGAIFEGIKDTIVGIFEAIKYALVGDPIVLDMNEEIIKSFKDMVTDVINKIKEFQKNIVDLFNKIKDAVTKKVTELTDSAKKKWNQFKTDIQNTTNQMQSDISSKWAAIKTDVTNKAEETKTSVHGKFEELKNNIGTVADGIKANVSGKFEELKTSVGTSVSNIQTDAETKFNNFSTNVGNAINGLKTNVEGTFSQMKSSIDGTVDSIGSSIDTKWRGIVSTFQDKVKQLKDALNFSWSLPAIKTPHFSWTTGGSTATGAVRAILEALHLPTSLPKFNVSWYAKGGFLPDQFSLFGMGENGIPEMLGEVGGRPAVAGGVEITGIKDAITESSQREMALMREEINLLHQIVAKDFSIKSRDVFSAVQSEAKSYSMRTGNVAFQF